MDIEITTSDPGAVNAEDVATAVIDEGYYVQSVIVKDRRGIEWDQWRDGNHEAE